MEERQFSASSSMARLFPSWQFDAKAPETLSRSSMKRCYPRRTRRSTLDQIFRLLHLGRIRRRLADRGSSPRQEGRCRCASSRRRRFVSARVRRPRDHVTPPPQPKSPKPVIKKSAKAQGGLLRIYTASTHTPDEPTFRHYGPALRFDHHRGSMAAAEVDVERGIWYGAALRQPSGMVSALEVCMWECFGAERRVDMSRFLGRVQVRGGESLRLLDLTGAKAIEAGRSSS